MTAIRILKNGGQTCCFDPSLAPDFTPDYFSVDYWQHRHAITGQSHGRGITWFIQHQTAHWVLRHYWRGGLIGRYVQDQFCFTRLNLTRSFAEFNLLHKLVEDELPVPRPVAARVVRQGLFYKADILIERIPGAEDLVQLLKRDALPRDTWQQIGQVLAQFHQAGVYHSDLNAHNILRDTSGKIWVIDFDKGNIRRPGRWQAKNLARLYRSLQKESALHPLFHWQSDDWQNLLVAYQAYR
ncbi:3-deoxy-D-manno-octulosonic acid kinase [Tolumonas lignilytica]|uniref:3-deoxy-D-manno-octulosonic acid kinase n=1 Tax=Tolumonas lignilytica TaxID=1283284 RepID=UPI0004B3E686|nr:3-deoxy-D-manno-octulosonic acid kinase [Tolumonas lignilytica]